MPSDNRIRLISKVLNVDHGQTWLVLKLVTINAYTIHTHTHTHTPI